MTTTHRDRATALAVIGGLEILAGLGLFGMAALLTIVVLAGHSTLEAQGVKPGAMLPGIGFYTLLGAIGVALGAGLIKCRRWARALSLIAAWFVVAVGALGTVTYVAIVPSVAATMTPSGGAPIPAGVIAAIGVLVCLVVFVGPGLIVALVLRGRDARLTCEWRDRQERWTDRCPLPVLALSVLLGLGAVAVVPSAFTTPVFVAGHSISGPAATAIYLAMAMVIAAIAVGLYRLRAWAWWAELVLLALGIANAIPFFTGGELGSFYRDMGLPPDQAALATALISSMAMRVLMVASAIGVVAWLLLIRKHFRKDA